MADQPIPIYNPAQGGGALGFLNQILAERPQREAEFRQASGALDKAYQARAPEGDDAEQWGALAKGFAAPAQNFWQSLAAAGAQKAAVVNQQAQQDLALERERAKLQFAEAAKRADEMTGSGAMTQLLHSALNPIMNIGGVGVNRLTGATEVPKELVGKYLDLKQKYYKQLVESGIPNADTEADRLARQSIYTGLRDPSVSGSMYAQRPENAPLPAQTNPPIASEAAAMNDPRMDKGAALKQLLRDYSAALASGDEAKIAELQTAINDIRKAQPTTVANADRVIGAQPKGKAELENDVQTAKNMADLHKKYSEDISATMPQLQQMQTLLGQIQGDLDQLKPGSPIEPGKLANFNTGMLSWMKAMGVPLSDEAEKSIASSIAMGKANIKLSAADTRAISARPAVFEFMKMLQANPGPELTAETIKKLSSYMAHTVEQGVQKNDQFAQWSSANPRSNPAEFDNYWNLITTKPQWWNAFSDNFEKANGHRPSYTDLAEEAAKRGITFGQLIGKMQEAARGK